MQSHSHIHSTLITQGFYPRRAGVRQSTATVLCSHVTHGQVTGKSGFVPPLPSHSRAGIAAEVWEGVGQPQVTQLCYLGALQLS